MNRYPLMVGAAIAGLMLLGLLAIGADRKAAVAPGHAAAQRFDAGRIVANLPYELVHRFEFRNDTKQTIEISELKTSCGCTDVDAPARSLAPGQSAWLEATAMIQTSGQFETEATILWSTGEKTRLMLGAFVQVSREIFLSTGSVDLSPGESRSLLLTCLDQNGIMPGNVVFKTPEGMAISVGPWQTIVQSNGETGVVGRFCAVVQVDLNAPIDQIGHVFFSLESFPDVQPAELTIRTPALVQAYTDQQRARRRNTGPIAIPHTTQPAETPSTGASARP